MRIGPGTRALVTGASRGIGRSLARALAARGAAVGLVARDAEALERLAAELGARALPADVGDRAAIGAAVDAFGDLDLLVANAGIAHYGEFASTPLERAEQMTRVNWLGTLYTVHAALPHLHRGGHIVVVSSGAGLRAFPGAAAYGATKAAQRAFAEALRHELAATGVSVTTVFPGEIDTALHAHEPERMPAWYGSRKASPDRLAAAVIAAVEQDRRTVAYPREVALLGLNGLAPGLTDRLLRRLRGAAAAPRTDHRRGHYRC
ncbi:MAG TPA: SDR family NAD(P)-dependent oxidoreductase [Solirubrobacteraceae bacterium]|jgi:short-subunit dehydrogenase